LIYINTRIGFWGSVGDSRRVEAQMKLSIAFAAAWNADESRWPGRSDRQALTNR